MYNAIEVFCVICMIRSFAYLHYGNQYGRRTLVEVITMKGREMYG